jgi:hypothetical protein
LTYLALPWVQILHRDAFPDDCLRILGEEDGKLDKESRIADSFQQVFLIHLISFVSGILRPKDFSLVTIQE